MGVFNPAVITNKGLALSSKAVAGVTNLQFTRLVIGSGTINGDLSNLTEIPNTVQTEVASFVVREEDYTVKVYANFSNKDLTQGYYMRSVGLYANDPDIGEILFCVATADESEGSADWVPPFSKAGLTNISVGMSIAVSNSTEVSIIVDDTASVPLARFMAHINDYNNPHKVTAEQIGAVPNKVHWYRNIDGDSLLNFITALVRAGYTSGYVQISFSEGVPVDVPKRFLSRNSLFAQIKFVKYGFEYAEVTLSADAEALTFFRKCKIAESYSNWLFDDWKEIISADGYLPRDGSQPMTGSLTIGNGQAKFASNEYIATINAYKDVNNPTDAYGSIWIHNDGAVSHTVEMTRKESGKNAETYQIFGTHNKCTGTYRGSERQRLIDVGGIGSAVLITATILNPTDLNMPSNWINPSWETMAIVTFAGAFQVAGGLDADTSSDLMQIKFIHPSKLRLVINPATNKLAILIGDGTDTFDPDKPTLAVACNRINTDYQFIVL